MVLCPECGSEVSDSAGSCPQCGHPLKFEKSQATWVLWLGILGIWPIPFFGPVAWVLGNRELRAVDAGRRPADGRSRTRIGRRLGMVGTFGWALIVAIAAGVGLIGRVAAQDSPDVFFAEHGITFVYPDDWQPMETDEPPEPVWQFGVTPDRSSGNWISFFYYPRGVAGRFGATEETFAAFFSYALSAGEKVTRGPEITEIAGIRGMKLDVAGLLGERTGTPLDASALVLFGEEASYSFLVQFDEENRDLMLSAWQTMLDNLRLSDVSARNVRAEFDELLVADFEGDPSPFETGESSSGRLTVQDGLYRAEVESDRLVSYGPFPVPTQSVTIIVDVEKVDGLGEGDGFGLGCVNANDRGYMAVLVGGAGIILFVETPSDEEGELLLADPYDLFTDSYEPLLTDLRQVALTCSVDSGGNALVALAVNGEERARLTNSNEAITAFTAVELLFSSTPENRWVMDIDSVEAHAPRPDDPVVP